MRKQLQWQQKKTSTKSNVTNETGRIEYFSCSVTKDATTEAVLQEKTKVIIYKTPVQNNLTNC